MDNRIVVLAASLWVGCTSSGFQQYKPAEIDVQKKSVSFAEALEAMEARDLRILEDDEPKGILSTQWEKFGDKHYNVQILMSPVSAVVIIGCRIQKSMTMTECPASSSYPKSLVKLANELNEVLR